MKKLLLVIFVLAVVIVGLLFYLGFFSKVVIREKEVGPFGLVYAEHVGDYKKIASVQEKIYYSLLDGDKISTTKGFGIYFDDPNKVKTEKLRSVSGCILEAKDLTKLSDLSKKYKTKLIDKQNMLMVEFPYKNSFSIMLGVIKVYPIINQHLEEFKLPPMEIMEIYDLPNKKIIYLVPFKHLLELDKAKATTTDSSVK